MKWRVVGLQTHDAYFNMALDEAVSEGVRDGTSPPTIRFYNWKPSAVSIGYFQGIRDEVNLDVCKDRGIDCIRRWTGGGAVYHDNRGEITYSVIAPEGMFPDSILESYEVICSWLIKGLEILGLEAVFCPINDILVGNKKISGSAQTRRRGILLQHGTVLYDLDLETMFGVLNVSNQKITDKMIQGAEDRVTCILKHADVDKQKVYEALDYAFTFGKECEPGTWSESELNRARELAENKYRTDDWMYLR